jgi:hypothetical protein
MLADCQNLVIAMGLVMVAWIAMGMTSLAIGIALAKILRQDLTDESNPYFWVGLCMLSAWVLIWNFFLPLSWHTLLTAFLIGALVSGRSLWVIIKLRWEATARNRWALLGMALFALWTANRCIGPNLYHDAGIYHTNQILWATEHPVIIGMANLNLLLASNTSNLLIAATIDIGPLHLHSMMIFNGLLIIVTMWQAIRILNDADGNHCSSSCLLVLPCILIEFAGTAFLASTDFASGILVLQSLPMIINLFLNNNKSIQGDARDYVIAVLLLTTSFCMKQSTIFFSTLAFFLLTFVIMARYFWSPKVLLSILGCAFCVAGAVLFPWMLRSILICGYPMYFPFFGLPVDWRIPAAVVERHAQEFVFTAKYTLFKLPPNISVFEWHKHVLTNFITQGRAMFVLPLILACAALIPVLLRKNGRRKLNAGFLLLCIIFGISFLGWIELATHLRYGFFIMWGFAGLMWVTLIASFDFDHHKKYLKLGIFGLSLVLGMALILTRFMNNYNITVDASGIPPDRPLNKPGSYYGFHPEKWVEIQGVYKETVSGLKVLTFQYKPMWDAPLPNTFFFNKDLQLVVPGDLRSGFRIVPRQSDSEKHWGERNYLMEPTFELYYPE